MSTSTEESLPRETGAEKAEQLCPVCGGPMQVTTSEYGSTSADCPTCRGKALAPEKAAEQPTLQRQTGSPQTPATPATPVTPAGTGG